MGGLTDAERDFLISLLERELRDPLVMVPGLDPEAGCKEAAVRRWLAEHLLLRICRSPKNPRMVA